MVRKMSEKEVDIKKIMKEKEHIPVKQTMEDHLKAWEKDGEKPSFPWCGKVEYCTDISCENCTQAQREVSAEEDYDDASKEECEHNQPFWECEICGNIRAQTEKITRVWKLDPKILNEADKYILVERDKLEKLRLLIANWNYYSNPLTRLKNIGLEKYLSEEKKNSY